MGTVNALFFPIKGKAVMTFVKSGKKDSLKISQVLRHSLRDINLSSLKEYFNSNIWRSIRREILKDSGKLCCSCNKKTRRVRLFDYHTDTLLGKNRKYIKCICESCEENQKKKKINKVNVRICPNCSEQTLTQDEIMINKWGELNQKTVCKECRITAIDNAQIKNSDYSVEDYQLLPEYQKYNVKDFFFSRKRV